MPGLQFVEPISVSAIQRGLIDDTAQAVWKHWSKTCGVVDMELRPLLQHCTIFEGFVEPGRLSRILGVGRHTITRRMYEGRVEDLTRQKINFDNDFQRETANSHFLSSIDREPRIDSIGYDYPLPDGEDCYLHYDRIVFPYTTTAGVSFLIIYAKPLRVVLPKDIPSRLYHHVSLPHTIDQTLVHAPCSPTVAEARV